MESQLILSGPDRRGWDFMHRLSGLEWQEGMWTICHARDDRIVGAFAYSDYALDHCALHFAGVGNWMTRDLLWKVFRAPFQQWGYTHLIGLIPISNPRSARVAVKLGFAIVPGPEQDTGHVFMRMNREDCRWLDLPRRKRWVVSSAVLQEKPSAA